LRLTARTSGTVGYKPNRLTPNLPGTRKHYLIAGVLLRKYVVKDFEKLPQSGKSCLPSNIKMYIDEQKADSLQQAAVLADDYSLTHHSSFAASGGQQSKLVSSDANHRKFHGDESSSAGKGEDFLRGPRRSMSGAPVCNYYKRRGHVISECRTLEK